MRNFARIDTGELKSQITRQFGYQKAETYFFQLNRLLSLRIKKSEFNKVFISTIGKENVQLHNKFINSIIKNACLAKAPPSRGSKGEGDRIANGHLQSPCRGRSQHFRECKSTDRPSPLGPNGKVQSIVCGESAPRTQNPTELVSPGSRPHVEVFSVEEGEEVDQMMGSPSIQSRSPVRAPLGIPMGMGGSHKALCNNLFTSVPLENCRNSYKLPDTMSLKKRLEQKLEKEGLRITTECVDLLNNGLDAFLKRLVKPCVQQVGSGSVHEQKKQVEGQVISGLNGIWPNGYMQQQPVHSKSVSLLDFRTAMELDPKCLGEDWPVQLERVCLVTVGEGLLRHSRGTTMNCQVTALD